MRTDILRPHLTNFPLLGFLSPVTTKRLLPLKKNRLAKKSTALKLPFFVGWVFTFLLAAACLIGLSSCQDEVSGIGSSLAQGEVTITSDSIERALTSHCNYSESIDGRNMVKLLGRINVPEYGSLRCSFVTQMLSATVMNIPDSITESQVDSMRLVLSVPRGSLTGDSLAPQQLRVFRLNRQLPKDLTSTFDPAGYYDPSSPIGSATYTLSNIAKGDSALKKDAYVRVPVKLPLDFARQLFRMYRAGDPVFQWPATFNEFFPGIYVEQNFGNGAIANITAARAYTYWNRIDRTYDMMPDSTYQYVDHIRRDSVCLIASQPEVLSSNVLDYRVSDYIKGMVDAGETVITTPGGYSAEITFPVMDLIDQYKSHNTAISMVSSLALSIPGTAISNDHGIDNVPYLLMIKRTEAESFFAENKVPDNKSSFYAAYDSEKGAYRFTGMRPYFLEILKRLDEGGEVNPEDTDFLLLPVNVSVETVENYNSTLTVVTACQPYLSKPTMTRLHPERAVITFTYSTQHID